MLFILELMDKNGPYSQGRCQEERDFVFIISPRDNLVISIIF